VPYHNFRHVVDVLQAVFHLLVRIGTLPSFPPGTLIQTEPKSPLVEILRPFEALSLLIAAIGHDVGHPGVNNLFLVKIKAPLAQMYNDKSVLESYHTAVYCHILKRLWPAVVDNEEMKLLLTNSILSTDMGIHNEYMEKLGSLQELLRNQGDEPTIPAQDFKKYRHLACNLLIKCADISNVVSA
jgi:3',5'-cyclic-nucleotide phosphodiesterase